MKSLKEMSWATHLIELVVVIVGILIAFQLNEYAAKRSQNALLDNHREYILDETLTNRQRLASTLELSENNLQTIDRLSQLISEKGDVETINNLALELLIYHYAYFKSNAYRALTDSGDIRFMNFSEKSATVNLYEYYGWINSIDSNTVKDHSTGYSAMLRKYLDFANKEPQNREVYESKEFLNNLHIYRANLQYKIKKYKDCLQVMDAYIKSMS